MNRVRPLISGGLSGDFCYPYTLEWSKPPPNVCIIAWLYRLSDKSVTTLRNNG